MHHLTQSDMGSNFNFVKYIEKYLNINTIDMFKYIHKETFKYICLQNFFLFLKVFLKLVL